MKQNKEISNKFSEVKPYQAWRVAQSNPCFEIWLYYHHYNFIPEISEIAQHPSFKSFIDSRIAGGFDFQRDQVRLKEAIENAKKFFERSENGNPIQFSTEQYLLGEEILRFVNKELQKLKNKLG